MKQGTVDQVDESQEAVQRGQVSAGCLVKSPDLNATPEEVKSCIQNDQLLLACGKKVPLLSNACVEPLTGVRSKMPVVKDWSWREDCRRFKRYWLQWSCSQEGPCRRGSVHRRL